MATILYARVSTAEQTVDHQISDARKQGFVIDEVVCDDGVSGVSTTLKERTEGRRLYDMLRAGDTLVVRFVDRLGRNYEDVTEVIRCFMRRGVIIKTVINGMVFDGTTTDPIQMAIRDALIAFLAATAQSQAETLKDAQRAGIAHARETEPTAYLGRKPTYTRAQFEQVMQMIGNEASMTVISKVTGVHRNACYKIKADPANAAKALELWEAKATA